MVRGPVESLLRGACCAAILSGPPVMIRFQSLTKEVTVMPNDQGPNMEMRAFIAVVLSLGVMEIGRAHV